MGMRTAQLYYIHSNISIFARKVKLWTFREDDVQKMPNFPENSRKYFFQQATLPLFACFHATLTCRKHFIPGKDTQTNFPLIKSLKYEILKNYNDTRNRTYVCHFFSVDTR